MGNGSIGSTDFVTMNNKDVFFHDNLENFQPKTLEGTLRPHRVG